jgi:curved DNA-binding protein CbpA
MATPRNPYETLGVPKSASTNAIRRAYRRKAKRAHPDAGGSADEFNALSKAMILLTNLSARAKFDETGFVDEPKIDQDLSDAISFIMAMIDRAVEEFVNGNGKSVDPCSVNLIEILRIECRRTIAGGKEERAKLERKAEVFRNVKKRVKARAGEPNMLERSIEHRAAYFVERSALLESKIAVPVNALKLLEGYSFDAYHVPGHWALEEYTANAV